MSATALLRAEREPDRGARSARRIQGNICRCTGYWNIVEAVKPPPEERETTTDAGAGRGDARRRAGRANVPRKEDKRLVQGEGVFFDDVKRHGMGYVHFVRSPYAHAKIVSIDVSKALEIDGRLRDADGGGGRDPHRPVLRDRGAARREPQGLRPRGRQGAVRRRAGRRGRRRDARARARRGRARRGRVRAARRRSSTRDARRTRRAGAPRRRRHEPVWEGVYEWGDFDARVRGGGPVVRIERAPLRPLLLDAARVRRRLVEYNRGTGQWTITATTRCRGSGRS